MKKPAGPRPVTPRHRMTLRKIARDMKMSYPFLTREVERQAAAVKKLAGLMKKEPRLDIRIPVPGGEVWETLSHQLPALVLIYRASLPEGTFRQVMTHLLRVEGFQALYFYFDRTDPVSGADVRVLQELGLDLAAPSAEFFLKKLVSHRKAFPQVEEMMQESSFDPLRPVREAGKEGSSGGARENLAGMIVDGTLHARYVRALLGVVSPDAIEMKETHMGDWLGEGEEEDASGTPFATLPHPSHPRWTQSHGSALQKITRDILVDVDEKVYMGPHPLGGDTLPDLEEKAQLLLGAGANPAFRPDWSHYPAPVDILEEGTRALLVRRNVTGDDARLEPLRRLGQSMNDALLRLKLQNRLPAAEGPSFPKTQRL